MTTTAPNPHAVRRHVNRLAEVLMLLAAGPRVGDFQRASGDCQCDGCGEPYWRHAVDPRERWLTVLCDGRRVKL